MGLAYKGEILLDGWRKQNKIHTQTRAYTHEGQEDFKILARMLLKWWFMIVKLDLEGWKDEKGLVCRKKLESTDWLRSFQKRIWSKILHAIWVKLKQSRERETHQHCNIIWCFHLPKDVISFLPCHQCFGFLYACHGCGDHIFSHGECHQSPLFLYTLSRCVHLASKYCYVSPMFTDHCLFEN